MRTFHILPATRRVQTQERQAQFNWARPSIRTNRTVNPDAPIWLRCQAD
ncbi:MAG: hypothetical protein GX601_15620 [Anaerolineales bacterium]|nr:hypothetical protein [Anaerolineales bacterium]